MNTEIAAVLSKDMEKLSKLVVQCQQLLGQFAMAQGEANEIISARLTTLEEVVYGRVPDQNGAGITEDSQSVGTNKETGGVL